jgi:prepilin-type N-terminal cleavage/methylation domain-containing protein
MSMRKSRPSSRDADQQGFTLIEMLAVVGMIVILMALLLPAVIKAKNRSAVKRADIQVATLAAAIQQYHYEFKKFPAPKSDLDAGAEKSYANGPAGNHLVVDILLSAGKLSRVDYRFDGDGNILTPRAVGDDYYQITLDLDYDGKVNGMNESVEVRY